MPNLAVKEGTEITRPLKDLIPLIKREIELGNEASKEHYARAGAYLLEAKAQVPSGQWHAWLQQHFKLQIRAAQEWMALARVQIRSPRVFERASTMAALTRAPDVRIHPPDWHEPVADILERMERPRAALNFQALQQEHLERYKEKQLRDALALELIAIGYKVLATKLHPDAGGSTEAMNRLNAVRDHLKHLVAANSQMPGIGRR